MKMSWRKEIMPMITWTPRNLRHSKGSQTPGKSKQESCQAGVAKKYFAKNSRSYKHPDYSIWCANMDRINGIKR